MGSCASLHQLPSCALAPLMPPPPDAPLPSLAGRAAMIGFAALLIVEAVKGSALF